MSGLHQGGSHVLGLTQHVRDVLALFVEHVREVHREARLDVADDEAVGETNRMEAVQCSRPIRPLLRE